MGEIRVHYWIDGDELWSADAEHSNGGFRRVDNTKKLVRKFASHEEANEALERLRGDNISKKA